MTYPDLLCLCHLRWSFVFQRLQHLMTRFAATRRVIFLEEPVFGSTLPLLGAVWSGAVCVLAPQLPETVRGSAAQTTVSRLLRTFLAEDRVEHPVLWVYAPMMLPLADGIHASAIVYDRMDELSSFAFARRSWRRVRARCSTALIWSSPAARVSTKSSGRCIQASTPTQQRRCRALREGPAAADPARRSGNAAYGDCESATSLVMAGVNWFGLGRPSLSQVYREPHHGGDGQELTLPVLE